MKQGLLCTFQQYAADQVLGGQGMFDMKVLKDISMERKLKMTHSVSLKKHLRTQHQEDVLLW